MIYANWVGLDLTDVLDQWLTSDLTLQIRNVGDRKSTGVYAVVSVQETQEGICIWVAKFPIARKVLTNG